jgi:UPF0042 nucleotide-binding protein
MLPFKESAHFVLDTSEMSVHGLKREMRSFVDGVSALGTQRVRVNFVSFGFKYGLPLDCDLVVDVRFLPNPYFVSELREKTGLERSVAQYVLTKDDAQAFITHYMGLLSFLIPRYVAEGKAYLNIGIGCTGGQHRSVSIAEELCAQLSRAGLDCFTSATHRDIERGRTS